MADQYILAKKDFSRYQKDGGSNKIDCDEFIAGIQIH